MTLRQIITRLVILVVMGILAFGLYRRYGRLMPDTLTLIGVAAVGVVFLARWLGRYV